MLSPSCKGQNSQPGRLHGKHGSHPTESMFDVWVDDLVCIRLIPCVSPSVPCAAGSLFKPGGEVCRHGQGAYNAAHAANGRTNGHVQPHGHPVWSLWRICTGSKYRPQLSAWLWEGEYHLEIHQNTCEWTKNLSRSGSGGFSVKVVT